MKMWNFRPLAVFCLMLTVFGWIAGSVAPAEGGKQLAGFGKYRVIRIDPDGVFPRILRVEAGTTVIWFNATDRYSSVVFSKGDILKRATRSPTLFFMAPDGTYVSAAFGSGATASSAFVKPGTYYYFVTGLPVSDGGAFAQVVVK